MNWRVEYERDDETFDADAYHVDGYRGIACSVLGWEMVPDVDEDGQFWGEMIRTGEVVCMMVGDDRKFVVGRDEVTPMEREEYCGVCGQMGCGHDGLDREE